MATTEAVTMVDVAMTMVVVMVDVVMMVVVVMVVVWGCQRRLKWNAHHHRHDIPREL